MEGNNQLVAGNDTAAGGTDTQTATIIGGDIVEALQQIAQDAKGRTPKKKAGVAGEKAAVAVEKAAVPVEKTAVPDEETAERPAAQAFVMSTAPKTKGEPKMANTNA
ncbi:MAG: hypothetical protein RSC08_05950, partial [Oscillospiraceae bacterium]